MWRANVKVPILTVCPLPVDIPKALVRQQTTDSESSESNRIEIRPLKPIELKVYRGPFDNSSANGYWIRSLLRGKHPIHVDEIHSENPRPCNKEHDVPLEKLQVFPGAPIESASSRSTLLLRFAVGEYRDGLLSHRDMHRDMQAIYDTLREDHDIAWSSSDEDMDRSTWLDAHWMSKGDDAKIDRIEATRFLTDALGETVRIRGEPSNAIPHAGVPSSLIIAASSKQKDEILAKGELDHPHFTVRFHRFSKLIVPTSCCTMAAYFPGLKEEDEEDYGCTYQEDPIYGLERAVTEALLDYNSNADVSGKAIDFRIEHGRWVVWDMSDPDATTWLENRTIPLFGILGKGKVKALEPERVYYLNSSRELWSKHRRAEKEQEAKNAAAMQQQMEEVKRKRALVELETVNRSQWVRHGPAQLMH